ncbi:hypothetical protein F4859DRAFT_35840 [Xylaria cf. heliscus]|nr:hypothetical protein F4859DRAFT_35840 [Xylaria cf. heliscus]
MVSDLRILKTNAAIIPPTDERPYYQVSVAGQKGCTVSIAATAPIPVYIHIDPLHPDFKASKPKPEEYVTVSHAEYCRCARYSLKEKDLFKIWQDIHLTLRHEKGNDQASYAFYPEFEYETGESLAHASLTASLALGRSVPRCYKYLVKTYGTRERRQELEREERHERGEYTDYEYTDDEDEDW